MDAQSDGGKISHGYWLVAFVDLLGQQEAFLKTDGLPDQNDPVRMEVFYSAMKASHGAIQTMRNVHDQFRDGFSAMAKSDDESSGLYGLTPEQMALARTIKARSIREHRWSDGVMLACQLKREAAHSPMMAVDEIVCTCAALMLNLLAMGHPIRGGLDVGTGAVLDDELFGAAIVKAYQLESKRAHHPRLVVGKTLVEYVEAAMRVSRAGLQGEFERGVAAGLRRAFVQDPDGDGEWIVDYVGPWARERFLVADGMGLVDRARGFVHQSRTDYQARGNVKLFERYSKVARYLDARA